MLFRKKQPRSCSYCTYGTQFNDTMILCAKRGVKSTCDSCIKFSYDPCKRVPPKPKALDFVRYSSEDFQL